MSNTCHVTPIKPTHSLPHRSFPSIKVGQKTSMLHHQILIGRTLAMGYMVVAMFICFSSAFVNLISVDAYGRMETNGTIAGWGFPMSSYSTRVKIGIWGSQGQHHTQESGASLSIGNIDLDRSSFNTIEAGFHVLPALYNNNGFHFFIRWTKDNYKSTGCYNLDCPGFVPPSGAALVPGQAVAPPSTYDREDRYITISLHTDPNTEDWVLYRDDLEKPSFLGHFPKEFCPKIWGIAPLVAWTGFVRYGNKEGGPAMGSGHFPEEGRKKAAYFKNIKLFDSKANVYDPSGLIRLVNKPSCYKVSDLMTAKKDGHMFYYGGPTGCVG
ncbi:unnamed protein product [Triticum turgidum subsp. durum]|uniref:Neprosin PEP catalytic domain-containing protein n=1 Tax=Triticum turgidum subsp. durum TaxID=4567 RepID=A0A9R1ALG6_TRITD|nr:unnamed protein product [Triticum turgidum subsp. durum]